MKLAAWVLAILLSAGMAGAQDYLNCQYSPGWQQAGAQRHYTADNLFDYKDGAAEGYLSFGFVRMASVSCKSGDNTLDIDISQMSDPDSAWGIFAANSDPRQPIAPLGMGGQIQKQNASFARGPYYVEIVETASNLDADDTATMKAFAAGIEAHIEGRTAPPSQLKWFPAEDLVSVRLIPESVLGFKELKRGFVARYKQGQAFVVPTASPESAAATLKTLRARFSGATDAHVADGGFQAKAKYLDGICIFRKGPFLAGYANLPDAAAAATQAAKLAPHIP